ACAEAAGRGFNQGIKEIYLDLAAQWRDLATRTNFFDLARGVPRSQSYPFVATVQSEWTAVAEVAWPNEAALTDIAVRYTNSLAQPRATWSYLVHHRHRRR